MRMQRLNGGRRQRGYIMVMLLGLMTVMGILLMKAMPYVVAEVQRDLEDELVFRGESIARAIRLYQARTGMYPTSLDTLIKVRPPILRKVYKDPMTPDGEWNLVTAVQAGASGNTAGLPIVGVRSKSQRDSYKVYKGKTIYSDWVFSASDNLLGIPGVTPTGTTSDASGNASGTKNGGTSTDSSTDKK